MFVPPLFIFDIMLKIYKANTVLSINVVLRNNKNLHISFTPASDGSSTYATDDEEVQHAVEHNFYFGDKFKLLTEVKEEEAEKPATKEPEKQAVMRVKVSDLAAAKDYLAENCGISRTALRSEKSIIEQATANGIEFYGMNGEE